MPVSVKLYSTVISYAINQTICNYIPAMKLEKIIEIIQGKAVILSILLIKLHFSVRVKVYIMLSTFLLVFSSVLILFLLKSVQILLLPICSTSRWRWHTNLYLSIRNRTLYPDRNSQEFVGEDCNVHFWGILLGMKNLATH